MDGCLLVLALAALPAVGNFGGGALAELLPHSRRALSLALLLAAGIVLAVVGLKLLPETLEAAPPWVPILAIVADGGLFLLLDRALGYGQTEVGSGEEASGPSAIFAGSAWTCSPTAS